MADQKQDISQLVWDIWDVTKNLGDTALIPLKVILGYGSNSSGSFASETLQKSAGEEMPLSHGAKKLARGANRMLVIGGSSHIVRIAGLSGAL
ncbi:MAG: hypothetical protein GY696_33310, partial [Gammaproteobacteria bacterium]|nr:hypothetical protein [Gammaproteobacteria bacterium]